MFELPPEDFLQKPRRGEPATVKAVVHNQYNSPLHLYSQEKVAETLALTAQAFTQENGVSENHTAGPPPTLIRSAVLQAVNEEESAYRPANATNAATWKTAPSHPLATPPPQFARADPGTPGSNPRTPVYQPKTPQSPYQQVSQPSFYQQQQQQRYQAHYPESYPSPLVDQQHRAHQIQEAELRQRLYEQERQKQAEFEEQRFRQLQERRQEESEEEILWKRERQRIIQEEERRKARLRQEEQRRAEEQRRLEEVRRAEEQRRLDEQRRVEAQRQQEAYRKWQEEQQRTQQAQQYQQQYQQYQAPQQQYQAPQQQYRTQQAQPQRPQQVYHTEQHPTSVNSQWSGERRGVPTSSAQHQEQVGHQAQEWENKIRETATRMSFSPQCSPATRRRDNAWPPKESSVRWVPKTGFSPQFSRQSSRDSKRFVWPPPAEHPDGEVSSRPPSRISGNAWHPTSPTTASRTPPFARSPSLGRKNIAWPPSQPEAGPKLVPKPVARGLHRPEEYLHQHASVTIPATYRPPPNTSHY